MKLSKNDLTPPKPPEPPRAPWRNASFWIVCACILLLAVALVRMDVPVGIVVMIVAIPSVFFSYDVARQLERLREARSGVLSRRPTIEHWALLGVSALFCVMALVLWPQDWHMAAASLAFFGGCLLTAVAIIRRRFREATLNQASVSVMGGVDIYAAGGQLTPIAIGCVFVGSVLFFVGTNSPLLIRVIGAFMGIVGIVVLAMISLGLLSRQFMRFEPQGFVFGERTYLYQLAWDNIADVSEIEYANNPFVAMRLRNVAAVVVRPANRLPDFLRSAANNRLLWEVDVVLAPRMFAIDGPVLAAALQRYATDAAARSELTSHDLVRLGS